MGAKLSENSAGVAYSFSYIDKEGKTAISLPAKIVETEGFCSGKARVYRHSDTSDSNWDREFNYIDTIGKLLLDSRMANTAL